MEKVQHIEFYLDGGAIQAPPPPPPGITVVSFKNLVFSGFGTRAIM